jgi:hypothetical protein
MFTQAEIDNKALELKLKKAQLKKALDAAKNASADGGEGGGGNSGGSGGSTGASANSGSTNSGAATDEQKFQWSRILQGDKAGQQSSAMQQQSDLEAERRRQAAALALSRVASFRS